MRSNVTHPKITAIIQTRIGATRLPGKVLMDIGGKPMLWHVLNRVKHSKKLDDIILAFPNTKENDILEKFAKDNKVKYYRGSEEDVLSRYYETAKRFNCDVIIRITSDCPLIDPKIVDIVIEKHLNSGADYTANTLERTCPRGLDVEVFNFEILKKAQEEAKEDYQREHVTAYIRERPEKFHLVNVKSNENFFYTRWTVDEIKDLEFVREVFKKLYREGDIFFTEDVINLLKECPGLIEINKDVGQKKHEKLF